MTLQVNSHRETHAIDSTAFKTWLQGRYFEVHDRPPQTAAVDVAIQVLSARALFKSLQKDVFVRVAEFEGDIYLDLGNPKWEAVHITPNGWSVVSDPPVKFVRPGGMKALPRPVKGGSLGELRCFVNVTDDDWILLVAWLISAFRPSGPFQVLELHGQQGAAKSTTSKAIRALIDPNSAPLRSAPHGIRDLMIAASNGWVMAYDNLSFIKGWLSDALCRLSTGGGYATRELYKDQEETILDAQRPVMLNGIEELASRGDLLDRAIRLELQAIPSDQRRSEDEFWNEFEKAQPRILGAFLSVVSEALGACSSVRLEELPRMADFVKWVVAAEPALGWEPGKFSEVYERNQDTANLCAIEANRIGPGVLELVENKDWSGTATELLEKLSNLTYPAGLGTPRSSSNVSGLLARLEPNLRLIGISVRRERVGHESVRIIHITKNRHTAVGSVGASAAMGEEEDAA